MLPEKHTLAHLKIKTKQNQIKSDQRGIANIVLEMPKIIVRDAAF